MERSEEGTLARRGVKQRNTLEPNKLSLEYLLSELKTLERPLDVSVGRTLALVVTVEDVSICQTGQPLQTN